MNKRVSPPEPTPDLAELDADALLQKLAESDASIAEGSAIYDLVNTVSGLLKEVRISAGLTQTELAEKLGVSQGRISQIESGLPDHAPSLEMIARVAHVCEVTPRFGFDAGSSPRNEERRREDAARLLAKIKATMQTQPQEHTVAQAKAAYDSSSSS